MHKQRMMAAWRAFMKTIERLDIGRDEVVLLWSVALLTYGAMPLAVRWCGDGRVAFVIPGIIGLWLAVPTRGPFKQPPAKGVVKGRE